MSLWMPRRHFVYLSPPAWATHLRRLPLRLPQTLGKLNRYCAERKLCRFIGTATRWDDENTHLR